MGKIWAAVARFCRWFFDTSHLDNETPQEWLDRQM